MARLAEDHEDFRDTQHYAISWYMYNDTHCILQLLSTLKHVLDMSKEKAIDKYMN